jgi:anti-sigma factor RsiW
MNPDPTENRLREKVWRRQLTPAEQAELRAWLAAHPEAQTDWTDESSLNRLLDRLPDAPVPSNFTARVLQAVEQEERARGRTKTAVPWWRIFAPRAAAAGFAAVLVFFGYRHTHKTTERREFVSSLEPIAQVSSTPPIQTLEDFEAIRRSSVKSAADEELISLMGMR